MSDRGRGFIGSKAGSRGWRGVNAKRGSGCGEGSVGCEPRIELIVKINIKGREGAPINGGGMVGVMMDVDIIEDLRSLRKFKKVRGGLFFFFCFFLGGVRSGGGGGGSGRMCTKN